MPTTHEVDREARAADVRFDPAQDAVVVGLRASADLLSTDLFDAIGVRQSTRLPFDGAPVTPVDLTALELAGRGPGVRVALYTDPEEIASISDLVTQANMVQLRDRPFRRELLSWIRFNHTTALRSGDGLAGRCTGNPSLPTWLGRLLAPMILRARPLAERDTTNIRSSAGVAVFVTAHDDKTAWIESGRAFQRFALRAALLGIRTAFVNQPIEVRSLRDRFESLLDLRGEHAQLAVRFGHGGLAPYSLRRPVDEVIEGT